jgi:hypothetical protein
MIDVSDVVFLNMQQDESRSVPQGAAGQLGWKSGAVR